MKRKHKKMLMRIILSAVLFAAAFAISILVDNIPWYAELLLFLPAYLIAGADVIIGAFSNIRYGRLLDENFLMFIATVGAFGLREYPDAVFVMIFYQIGELFQGIAVGKSRNSISALMDMKPEKARVIRGMNVETVAPEEVGMGEFISVRPGEKIPLDGEITEGSSELDCKALTGESIPRFVNVGDSVYSGSVNLTGNLKIRVTSEYKDSTVAKILDLVENASSVKARADRFITRFARVYTPCVVVGALLLFVIPSIITKDIAVWLGRALIFLLISCPCALVISVPMSYFSGLGAASKKGILIKGAMYLEALADVDTVVFDKTGTLTRGEFEVSDIIPADGRPGGKDAYKMIMVAAALESNSNHPVAKAVYDYCMSVLKVREGSEVKNQTEIPGIGVVAKYRGEVVTVGNAELMRRAEIQFPEIESSGSIIYVSASGEYLGCFIVKDAIKDTSKKAVSELKSLGVKRTVMLSGDREVTAKEIAAKVGLDGYKAELLPQNKVAALEELISKQKKGKKLVYVGDGINDAPVLTRADIGIAMGALGSDAAIEAADVVLMDDKPIKIADSLRIAKKTKRIVIQNIAFALAVKAVFMVLGAVGIANLWTAIFADVGVAIIAIINAMRALKA